MSPFVTCVDWPNGFETSIAEMEGNISQPLNTLRKLQVTMRTKQDCALAVSIYPRFSYDARGGGGTAQATPVSGSQRLQVLLAQTIFRLPSLFVMDARST